MPTIITPTPGRVVWLHMPQGSGLAVKPGQPLAAIVAAVHDDRSIAIGFFDAAGQHHSRERIALVQEGDTAPAGEFCTWMPFQQGQAKKEALTLTDLQPTLKRLEALEGGADHEKNAAMLKEAIAASFAALAEPLLKRLEDLEAQGKALADKLAALQAPAPAVETKVYADGTTATGTAPLPEQSPAAGQAVPAAELAPPPEDPAPAPAPKRKSTTSKPPIKNA